MSMPACARHATERSPMTTARPEWPARFSAPRRRTPSKTTLAGTLFYHALSDTHYSMIRRGGRVLSAALADRLGRCGDQRGRAEGGLRSGLGQPCALLPASHGGRHPHRTPAGLVSRPPASAAGRCRRVPIPIIRGPAGSSPTSACPAITESRGFRRATMLRAAIRYSSATFPEGIDCQRCHGPGGNHVRIAGRRRRQGGGHSRRHREPRPPEFQTRDGGLYAVPSGDHQRTHSRRDHSASIADRFPSYRASRSRIPQYSSIMRPGPATTQNSKR